MKRLVFFISCFFSLPIAMAQYKTRTAEELINRKDPGWVIVKSWIDSAKNKVEVLPADSIKSKDALYNTQVTSRSPMGAIIFTTGGILVDDGWIRILGSGSSRLTRSVPSWNKGKSYKEFIGEGAPFLLVADDAIGGFFLQNGGALGDDIGKIYYFSPDNLEYEALDLTYSEFLLFCFNNDLNKFYEGSRWQGWREETIALKGDEVFNFMPPLWAKEGKDIAKGIHKPVPVEEQFLFNLQMRKQLGLDK